MSPLLVAFFGIAVIAGIGAVVVLQTQPPRTATLPPDPPPLDVAEIRARLETLLGPVYDLESFDNWLVSRSWNMHRTSGPEARALVGRIQLALAEYDDDVLTDAELRAELTAACKSEPPASPAVEFGGGGMKGDGR